MVITLDEYREALEIVDKYEQQEQTAAMLNLICPNVFVGRRKPKTPRF
jgi:hypothetical protein